MNNHEKDPISHYHVKSGVSHDIYGRCLLPILNGESGSASPSVVIASLASGWDRSGVSSGSVVGVVPIVVVVVAAGISSWVSCSFVSFCAVVVSTCSFEGTSAFSEAASFAIAGLGSSMIGNF